MKPRPMNHKKIITMNPNQAVRGALALTCIAIAAILGCASAQAQAAEEPLITKPDDKAAEQVEEDIAFFEKKYQRKITGVKPKSEYDDPDQFYSAIGEQLAIPEIAWNAAAKKFGWKKDDGKHTYTMLKGGPVAGAAQGSWEVMFIRSTIDPQTNKPDPATMQQVMVRINYDGNVTFPMDPPVDIKAGYDVKTYQGDGQMVDKGKSAAADRFILNLGEIDFSKKKTYSYTLGNLPEVSLGAAFEIRDLPPLHPGDDTVKKDFNRASVHLLLKTVEGETIFEETAPLSEWTWGGTVGETERIIWSPQTKFTGKPKQQYVLTLRISPLSGSKDVKPALVRISGGGWKVTP